MSMLRLWFLFVLGTMLVVVIWASFHESILAIPPQVVKDPWFIATLFDTYFAFIAIYLWMAYRTPSLTARIFWFVMVMGLGNIGIALYILILIFRLPPGATVRQLLLKDSED